MRLRRRRRSQRARCTWERTVRKTRQSKAASTNKTAITRSSSSSVYAPARPLDRLANIATSLVSITGAVTLSRTNRRIPQPFMREIDAECVKFAPRTGESFGLRAIPALSLRFPQRRYAPHQTLARPRGSPRMAKPLGCKNQFSSFESFSKLINSGGFQPTGDLY